LVLKEVTTIDRIVKVLPFRITELPSLIVATVDTTLRTNAVGTLYWSQADQIDGHAQFSQLHRGRQAR
jgi:hypothetical protein